MDMGRGLLSKKETGIDKGKERVKNWRKCAGILYG